MSYYNFSQCEQNFTLIYDNMNKYFEMERFI